MGAARPKPNSKETGSQYAPAQSTGLSLSLLMFNLTGFGLLDFTEEGALKPVTGTYGIYS